MPMINVIIEIKQVIVCTCSFFCNQVSMFWNEVERNIKKYFISNFNFKPCHLLFGIDFNSKKEKDVDIILNYALFTFYKSFVGKN